MTSPFESPDETRRSYHSGLSGKVIDLDDLISPEKRGVRDREITFETAKYIPPFQVTLRTGKDWDRDHEGKFTSGPPGRWHFTLPGKDFDGEFWMKFMLDRTFWMAGDNVKVEWYEGSRYFTDAAVLFGYVVKFKTDIWRPNHLITLRNSVDGWGRDVYGVFRDDTWTFLLDRDIYPDAFAAKLVLDGYIFMSGNDLRITRDRFDYPLSDADVTFSVEPTAYRHGYDNFVSVETPLEQVTVRSVGREEDKYDVIVIGSGMGGGVLADALSDRRAKVLVLEAGGLRFPVHISELPRSEVNFVGRDQLGHFENRGNPYFQPGVHFNLGGRSVYWSGVIPRMQPWELRPVWPRSVRDYLTRSGYDDAEKLMRKSKTLGPFQDRVRRHLNEKLGRDFEAIDLPRSLHQPDIGANGAIQNVIKRSTGGFSTADLLLDSLGFTGRAGRDNLKVNLHHLATCIETSGSQACAVVCQDLVGKVERRYRGQYIVLACGSLESPKLAINSKLVDPTKKMGKGLTDHPAYFYQIHHSLPQAGPMGWIGDPRGHAKILIRHKRATSDAHAYNIELLINSRYWDTRHADDDLWDTLVDDGRQSKVEIKFLFDSPLVDANAIIPHGEGKKPDVSVAANTCAEHYKREMVEVRNQVLEALGVTAPSNVWNSWEWSEGIYGTVHHAGGTLRMSDDGSGVVDETLQFLAYDNLYCCDVSVFPSIPAANPSLTLAALALRLADTLARRLSLP